jgi:N6-adenosine-specific RNA methylase IME4
MPHSRELAAAQMSDVKAPAASAIETPPADAFLSERAKQILALGRRVIADVIEIGRLLSECRDRRKEERGWRAWLEAEFAWSPQTAGRFIQVHELSHNVPSLEHFDIPISGLYLLAAPSTAEGARVEVADRAKAGERLRGAEVKAIIDQHGEQRILAAAGEIRARRREEYRDRAQAEVHPTIAAGGTVEDLRRLAASGFRAGCIIADPPWLHATWSHHGLAGDRTQANRNQRSRHPPYDTMPLEEICALPVEALAAKDCVLFLWIVRSHMDHAEEVLKAWGFTRKSVAFVWVKGDDQENIEDIKVRMGTGCWTRAGSEQCWLATRGKPAVLYDDVRELIIERRREHSRKPDCVHDRVERLVRASRLELFATRQREGWCCWGNQLKWDPAIEQRAAQLSGLRREPRIPRPEKNDPAPLDGGRANDPHSQPRRAAPPSSSPSGRAAP